ncbi:histone deacetylase 8-like [Gordionus sp. m RMFG-2023]|uniref:histone deacetylase 8-like n=1 Tax=Gordionus sp. m RMFG-2023 TaxID=3053472 RepID=UPI0031FC48B6
MLKLNDLFFDEYGLSYDCVLSPSTYLYSLNVAGTSLACSNIANLYTYSKKNQNINIPLPIIFNFLGGWHHAQRSSASGYCYVNDIVICINDLKKIHTQILYIDLDLHHCDGVEEAFSDCNTNGTILIISIHHFSPGFFPGTGQLPQQINMTNSKNKFNINIPLKEGICDTNYFALFKRVIESIYDLNGDQKSSANLPDVIIIQCGADVLVGDPHKVFNLTPTSIINCVNFINTHFCQKLNIPLIILGGGGYNFADTSRCWVQLVASLSNMTLDNDIPEHTYFPLYGPSYELSITPGLKKDSNDQAYLNFIVNSIKEQIK